MVWGPEIRRAGSNINEPLTAILADNEGFVWITLNDA